MHLTRTRRGHALVWLLAAAALPLGVRSSGEQPLTEAARADLYLSRLQGYGFAGALLVAHGDSAIVAAGYGAADREAAIPFGTRTLFDSGSITKQFTAAAILRLQADGRLDVHDSIGRFFPRVPPEKRGITIHHLLTHTSGLRIATGGDYRRVSRSALVARAMAAEMVGAPGEAHAYSNAGYGLLAAVVEIASGMPYEAFVKTRLFAPAGLRETGYTFDPSLRPRFAVGYAGGERWGIGIDSTAATGGEFWNLLGNGGLQSSAEDLHRWARALLTGRVLPADAVAELMRPHVLVTPDYQKSGSPLHYAYGWYVWERRGETVVFHNGGNGIFSASLWLYPASGRTLVYASNLSEFASSRTSPTPVLDRILRGDAVRMPPVARRGAPSAERRPGH